MNGLLCPWCVLRLTDVSSATELNILSCCVAGLPAFHKKSNSLNLSNLFVVNVFRDQLDKSKKFEHPLLTYWHIKILGFWDTLCLVMEFLWTKILDSSKSTMTPFCKFLTSNSRRENIYERSIKRSIIKPSWAKVSRTRKTRMCLRYKGKLWSSRWTFSNCTYEMELLEGQEGQ